LGRAHDTPARNQERVPSRSHHGHTGCQRPVPTPAVQTTTQIKLDDEDDDDCRGAIIKQEIFGCVYLWAPVVQLIFRCMHPPDGALCGCSTQIRGRVARRVLSPNLQGPFGICRCGRSRRAEPIDQPQSRFSSSNRVDECVDGRMLVPRPETGAVCLKGMGKQAGLPGYPMSSTTCYC
jgi:hypothetical protein